jgi:hypothetical protein
MADAPTNFVEANALLAMQSDDYDEAWRQLNSMTDHELAEVLRAANKLSSAAAFIRVERRKAAGRE